MKHKFNFATWWRHFIGRKIVEIAIVHFESMSLSTKMAPPGGEIKFVLNFPFYHMQKYFPDNFNILAVVRYRSFELT